MALVIVFSYYFPKRKETMFSLYTFQQGLFFDMTKINGEQGKVHYQFQSKPEKV
jgi:hypothetical protein